MCQQKKRKLRGPHDENTKNKISNSLFEYYQINESKNKGKVFSEETRKKMSDTHKLLPPRIKTKEEIDKIKMILQSDEMRKRLSEIRKEWWEKKTDRTVSEETRKKMSIARKGKKYKK